MPLAMSHMGILLGTIVILWAGLTAGFGLYLQTRCAQYLERGSASFFALSQLTYPSAAVIFDAAIAVKCFGVGVSYLIIIGDLMPGVVRGFKSAEDVAPFLVDRHFWVTAFMQVISTHPIPILTMFQACRHTSLLPPTSRLAQIHFRNRSHINRLPRYPSRLSLLRWRHAPTRPNPYSRHPLGRPNPYIELLPGHRLCLHLPSEHVLHPQ